jgi:hypothetical protein
MDGITGRVRTELDFRRVMASVTEQACDRGLEGTVMEALYPIILNDLDGHDTEDDGRDRPGTAPNDQHSRSAVVSLRSVEQ